jgi:hypothetical protein
LHFIVPGFKNFGSAVLSTKITLKNIKLNPGTRVIITATKVII